MRVLLAVDGSPSSESARRVVDAMAWPAGTIIRVLGVMPPTSPRLAAFGGHSPSPPRATTSRSSGRPCTRRPSASSGRGDASSGSSGPAARHR